MKQQLRLGQDTKHFNNTTIRRLYLQFELESDAVNTAVVGVNLDQAKVTLVINQGGQKMDKVVYLLPSLLNYYGQELGISQYYPDTNGYIAGVSYQTQSASTTQKTFVSVPIIISPMILKGDDTLDINIDLPTNIYAAENNSASNVYLTDKDGSGLGQLSIPVIDFYPMLNNETPMSRNLGDNITRICIIAADKPTFTEPFAPFTRIAIRSKFYDELFDWQELANQRKIKLATGAVGQIIEVLSVAPNQALQDCQVEISTVVANLTASKAYLVVERSAPSTTVAYRQLERFQRHSEANAATVGLTPSTITPHTPSGPMKGVTQGKTSINL